MQLVIQGLKNQKVIPFNQMTPELHNQISSGLAKIMMAAKMTNAKLTKAQRDYIMNQAKQVQEFEDRYITGIKDSAGNLIKKGKEKVADIFDLKGRKMDPTKSIIGGEQAGIMGIEKTSPKFIEYAVRNIKEMKNPQSVKDEINFIIKRQGMYKNLTSDDAKQILDAVEPIVKKADGGRIGLKDGEGIMQMASVDDPFYRDSEADRDDFSFRMFKKPYKDLTPDELEEFKEEMERLMNKFSKSKSEGIMMAGLDRKEKAQMLADQLAEEEYGMDFYDLPLKTQMQVYEIALDMIDEGGNAMGGLPNNRMNFALGTRPTAQESGLGGLPIEADMRYTGGFMPYGAKEKADDVPARLSKNEFVFTADAVRAAGGGSVNEGAKKMYQAMKQLEAKPEAKGMMA